MAFLEWNMMGGFAGWPLVLVAGAVALYFACKDVRVLSLSLLAAGMISGRLLAFALGTGAVPSRFYYVPAIFLATGLAVLLPVVAARRARRR